jgi:hypothetical protein
MVKHMIRLLSPVHVSFSSAAIKLIINYCVLKGQTFFHQKRQTLNGATNMKYGLFHKVENSAYIISLIVNWIYAEKWIGEICVILCTEQNLRALSQHPSPLWSRGQRSSLQIQRSRVRFSALPRFVNSSGSETGPTQPREDNSGVTWMKK